MQLMSEVGMNMSQVRIMPDSLANKIAAGEVVERPASVVKELMENSIDAGSKRIEIEIGEAGLSLIYVHDDGEGMEASDLRSAFLRHATSKMLDERDLFRIRTLGFRGEALPSIAAVSKVEAASRTKEDLLAYMLTIEGSKIVAESKTSHPIGTSVWVRDLFFNTPARLKYVKSLQTENNHIQDVVNRLALAHPEIAFKLVNDEREVLKTAGGGDVLSNVHAIYGLEIAKKMIPITGNHLDFQINGFIGKPEITRGSRSYITLLINGRFVRSYALQKAIIEGYHTLLPINRFPFVVLHITMDPSLVDVNVHPSKQEVRFSKEDELAKWLQEEVKRTLLLSSLMPAPLKQQKREYQQSYQNTFNFSYSPKSIVNDPAPEPEMLHEPSYTEHPLEKSKAFFARELSEEAPISTEPILESTNQHYVRSLDTRQIGSTLEPLAQLHGTYIVAQNEEGLYLVDQHAAQERINYERFRKILSIPSKSGQILALPYTYETTASEAEIIRSSQHVFAQLGIIQEPFGDRSFLVREIPDWFLPSKEEEQIDEIVQLIIQGKGNFSLADIRDRSAQLMACKASIKANQYLSRPEMESLLIQLSATENPFTCPHGRPITIHFSVYEIEKLFKRVM